MLPKAILVTSKTNIRYLSNFSGTSGYLLLFGKKMHFFTDSRYHILARAVLPRSAAIIDTTDGFDEAFRRFLKKHRVKKIGIEGNCVTLRFWKRLKKITKGIKLIDIEDQLDKRREIKKTFELRRIIKAQKITDEIFSIIKKWLTPGVTEKDIAWKIECLAHDFGACGMAFHPFVGFNENSASPHHHNTEKKLRRGDIILIDMGAAYKGYCSDMTRVIFTKTPTAEQGKIYELVLAAQEAAIKKLRPGVSGKKIDSFARSIIEKAGLGKCFGHPLGHGVGLDIHELPNLSKKYARKIPDGCVVTVEPGVYLPEKFGVRLEDMVLVTEKGVRNLTKSPKSIQEAVIRLE